MARLLSQRWALRRECESHAAFPPFFRLFVASLSGIEFIDHNRNVILTPNEDLRLAANIGKQSRTAFQTQKQGFLDNVMEVSYLRHSLVKATFVSDQSDASNPGKASEVDSTIHHIGKVGFQDKVVCDSSCFQLVRDKKVVWSYPVILNRT
ncbi:hypothetical protein Salat_0862600 [Sesamum alatum]|uniref:Uncharacterized protein n=1 Tax=Sesamum alatum TaxID=300844 RepID=A0AAE1YIT2_9LAMI|nr:hypothetical protein Salat_0862600 [Sesamum alatum]